MEAEEQRIKGRTEALDFIGVLIEKWQNDATKTSYDIVADAMNDCADELEQKMEDFANT